MISHVITRGPWKILPWGISSPAEHEIEKYVSRIEALLGEGEKHIAIEIKPMEYPFSGLLRFLVKCRDAIEQYCARIAIIQSNPEFLKVVKLTKLDRSLEFVMSEDEIGRLKIRTRSRANGVV